MPKREIFSMNRAVARNLLSRRFLRYEVTKNHYDALHVRHQILEKAFGQGKLSEKQFFAAKYRMHCLVSTVGWLMWSMWLYNDKYDHVAFLVKAGAPPKMYPDVPVRELHWTPFHYNFLM